MNELLKDSVYFGMTVSLAAYFAGAWLQKKSRLSILNPLLTAMILIILFLEACGIEYEVYDYGAKYLTYFLTPATICLAVPLYNQFQVLKKNFPAVLGGILCGCIAHALVVILIMNAAGMERELLFSLLPKSVTTPIALGMTQELGGVSGITIVGVCVAGILGSVVGPSLMRLFRVNDPIAVGLGLGTASHAIGTAKAAELGEIQAAMSSLAIVVTGLLTVILLPFVAKLL